MCVGDTVFIITFFSYFFQSGDSYLVGLATRYSTELRTNYSDVLQQLEDLRLAEWSDHAPPPPLAPGLTTHAMTSLRMSSIESAGSNPDPQRQCYVNYPSASGQDNEPTYVPGSYLVSL